MDVIRGIGACGLPRLCADARKEAQVTFDCKAFGEELYRVRMESGYSTVSEFARRAGIPGSTLWTWEAGICHPRSGALADCCRNAFGDRWLAVMDRLYMAAYKELP